MARLRGPNGRFIKDPNKIDAPEFTGEKLPRLRDEKGHFISGFKEKLVREMAIRNNAPDAQQFLRERIDELSGFIHDNKTPYVFDENNLEDALKNKQITLNGERASYGEAMMKTQEFVTFMRTNFESANIKFYTVLKNQREDRDKNKTKYDNWNNIEMNLPDVEKLREMLSEGATVQEIIEHLAEYNINVFLSEKK